MQKLINDKKSKNKIYAEDDNDKSDENNKIIIKKIKKHGSDLKNKNKNHFNKQILINSELRQILIILMMIIIMIMNLKKQ